MQLLFPYDATMLRCHPMAAFIAPKDKEHLQSTKYKSRKVLHFRCCICQHEFNGICWNISRQMMICKNHKKRGARVVRYKGNIPSSVSLPIRAGILLDIPNEKIVDLIMSLEHLQSKDNKLAESYIEEVSTYSKIQLADNCFWGDDSASRITKERYKRPKKKQKKNTSITHTTKVYFLIFFLLSSCNQLQVNVEAGEPKIEQINEIEAMSDYVNADQYTHSSSSLSQTEENGFQMVPYVVDPHMWDGVMEILRTDKNPLKLFAIWEYTIAPMLQVPFPINKQSCVPNESKTIAMAHVLADQLEELRARHMFMAWIIDFLHQVQSDTIRIRLQYISMIMHKEKIVSEAD